MEAESEMPIETKSEVPMEKKSKLKTFDVVMLVLTIVALVIAIVHLAELKQTVRRMETIQDGLSTQYLGAYPAFFPKIVQVVNNAQKSLVIVCDFPAYGSFSEPSTSEDYFHAIRKRRQFATLEVTFLSRAGRERLLKTLFTASEWGDWRTNAEKRTKVLRFLKLHGRSPAPIKTHDDLLNVLYQVNDETVRNVFVNHVNQTPVDIPIYFWIADCDNAVFTIASLSDKAEYGFYTSDKSLIRSLLDISKRYHGQGAGASQTTRCD